LVVVPAFFFWGPVFRIWGKNPGRKGLRFSRWDFLLILPCSLMFFPSFSPRAFFFFYLNLLFYIFAAGRVHAESFFLVVFRGFFSLPSLRSPPLWSLFRSPCPFSTYFTPLPSNFTRATFFFLFFFFYPPTGLLQADEDSSLLLNECFFPLRCIAFPSFFYKPLGGVWVWGLLNFPVPLYSVSLPFTVKF